MKEDNKGIIRKIIKGYNDARTAAIMKLSGNSTLLEDLGFLDDGSISARIEKLKKQYEEYTKEIDVISKYYENDEYKEDKLRSMKEKQTEISYQMAFLASNSMKSIESCRAIIEDQNSDFILCIDALKAYDGGNDMLAFEKFMQYFKSNAVILDHYLINKVYGTILFKLNQHKQAEVLIKKAIEKRPQDIELHCLIKKIYIDTKNYDGEVIESEIIELLEG